MRRIEQLEKEKTETTALQLQIARAEARSRAAEEKVRDVYRECRTYFYVP